MEARAKPRILKMKKEARACSFLRLPEARGRLDFRGWSLSSSISLISFRIYTAPERRQKETKEKMAFNKS